MLSRGAVLHLEARVDASPDVYPRISVEQCYGTGLGQQAHPWKSYMVVNSHGSVVGREVLGTAWERPQLVLGSPQVPAWLRTGQRVRPAAERDVCPPALHPGPCAGG